MAIDIPDALPVDALLELADRVKAASDVHPSEAYQLGEGVEILAADLENEREAHRLTVLELTAARERNDHRRDRIRLADGTRPEVGQRVTLIRAACERDGLAHAYDDHVHEISSLLGRDTHLVECGPRQISVSHLRLAGADAAVTCPRCLGWQEQMQRTRIDVEVYRGIPALREQIAILETNLTAAREEAGVTLQAAQTEIARITAALEERRADVGRLTGHVSDLEVVLAERGVAIASYQRALEQRVVEFADLKARLLGMTRCAADAAKDATEALVREGQALDRVARASQDTMAALAREGVALARLRAAYTPGADKDRVRFAVRDVVNKVGADSFDLDERIGDMALDRLASECAARAAEHLASVQPALERLAETVTGRPYPEVSADLDKQVAEHPGEELTGLVPARTIVTESGGAVIASRIESPRPPTEAMRRLMSSDDTVAVDDPDAIERVTPDEIAAALRAHREQDRLAGAPFVALADLVVDWMAATKAVYEHDRSDSEPWGGYSPDEVRAYEAMVERQDSAERALARAVAK